MTARPPRLALWILLAILGAATLAGEFLLFRLGLGGDALAVPVVTVGAGLAYLAWAAPANRAPAPAEEPFDDPVEEALRAETTPEGAPEKAPAVTPTLAPDPDAPDGSPPPSGA